jgi:hypothetical protein
MATDPLIAALDRLLDDAGDEVLAQASGASSPAAIREGARRRLRALAPELPRFHQRVNRSLFESNAALVGLYRALLEDGQLEREAALAGVDAVLQAAYNRRLASPRKGKLASIALRLPVLRNLGLRAAERAASEPGGFVMRRVDSPGDLLALDVERCPISTFFAEQGVPELGPLVCKLDDLLVAKLPGITLERSGTIATGAERCDFRYRRTNRSRAGDT